ncbi:MAG TPA: flagellar hook-basal body complex protein FliE [Methylomirabilota bacterium]|nr:flagellar hook-basal body complex protein FliE [Methylomirabilota bacterium]
MGPLSLTPSAGISQLQGDQNFVKAFGETASIINPADAEKISALRPGGGSLPLAGNSFEQTLGEMIREVNGRQADAAGKVQGLLAGEGVPLHQAVIAMEEASISFQLMVEMRNKLLEGYQELMRMQV